MRMSAQRPPIWEGQEHFANLLQRHTRYVFEALGIEEEPLTFLIGMA
jgi:hypothetical protein